MKKVSLVMIVKNEEKYLDRCLKSVKGSVDEIVIVDTGSTDNTKEIAETNGASVYDYQWDYDFAKARNYAISKSNGDWILTLDADEYVKKNYKKVIQQHIQKGDKIGRIKIVSKFEYEGETQEAQAFISRLFPRNVHYTGKIHEQLDTNLARVIVPIEVLHDGYYKTDKTERNITILEQELKNNPKDAYYLYQLGKEYKKREDYKVAVNYFKSSYEQLQSNRNQNYIYSVIVEYLNTLIKIESYQEGLNLIVKENRFMSNHPDFYFNKGILMLNYYSTIPNATLNDLLEIELAFLRCLQIGESNHYESVKGTGSFLAAYNLGLLYELLGKNKKAAYYYQQSAKDKYQLAIERLKRLKQG